MTKNKQIRILNKTKNPTQSTQQNFDNIEDNSDNISEIDDDECVDCLIFSIINVTLVAKDKDVIDSKEKLNDESSSTTKTSY